MFHFKLLREFDWVVIGTIFLLAVIGLSAVYSTSPTHLKKQMIFFVIGFILMFGLAMKMNYRSLKNYTFSFYLAMLLILVGVLIFGHSIRGVSSWFNLGFFAFQPVELTKLIMIIILAKFFSKYSHYLRQWRFVALSGIYLALPVGLTLLQPDFGSSAILVLIWFGMILAAGLTLKQFVILGLIFSILFVIAWGFLFKNYQKSRFLVFLNPQTDTLGYGYNVIQSIVAVGSGGFFGQGLGFGSQSQLKFLPERHTDFIFAVIAEELGFFGVIVLLSLFVLLFYRLFKIIFLSKDSFAQLLVVGVIVFLASHIIINIGMNVGLLPVAGISLPFISYGGSNLLIAFLAIGLIQSIYIQNK